MTAPAPHARPAGPARDRTSGHGNDDSNDDRGVPVLGFEAVSKYYRGVAALDQVNLVLARGTTLGLVGESGSGKSTCVRLALGLERPSSGRLTFDGTPYPHGRRRQRPLRRQIGFVLQDPYDCLDPRMRLRDIVSEPLRIHRLGGRDTDQRVSQMLAAVGLGEAPLDSYPARYSGGGRQRIAIARALITDPAVLLCDEPTSSLDVSVQAQIVNLLLEAKRSRDLSVLFVSHDLDLIGRVADTLVVLYRGRVVESGPAALVRARPRHHYTKALHDAVPADHPARRVLPTRTGLPPASGAPAADGCVFAGRCAAAQARCRTERPPVVREADGRSHACFFPLAWPSDNGRADHGKGEISS